MAITPIRPITDLGLKDVFNNAKSGYSTQGQGGYYKDPTFPGGPRKGAFKYTHPEKPGQSLGGVHNPEL